LIEPVHEQYWKMQVTVLQRLKQNSTFKHENGEILNLETSSDVIIQTCMGTGFLLSLKALFFYIKPIEIILNSGFSDFVIFLTCTHSKYARKANTRFRKLLVL
jgi:hypothetical protein